MSHKKQKDDVTGKPPMQHLAKHWPALAEMARLTQFGAEKYSRDSWLEKPNAEGMYGAMLRHAFKSAAGEELDEESEIDHLACVAWNALTLLTHRKLGRKVSSGGDSRMDIVSSGDGKSFKLRSGTSGGSLKGRDAEHTCMTQLRGVYRG